MRKPKASEGMGWAKSVAPFPGFPSEADAQVHREHSVQGTRHSDFHSRSVWASDTWALPTFTGRVRRELGLEPPSFNSQATFSALLKLILSEQWSFKLRHVPTHVGLSGRVKRRNVSPRGIWVMLLVQAFSWTVSLCSASSWAFSICQLRAIILATPLKGCGQHQARPRMMIVPNVN